MPWEQLASMLKETRDRTAAAQAQPPVACPICGMALDVHPDGRRNCPMGDYRYQG